MLLLHYLQLELRLLLLLGECSLLFLALIDEILLQPLKIGYKLALFALMFSLYRFLNVSAPFIEGRESLAIGKPIKSKRHELLLVLSVFRKLVPSRKGTDFTRVQHASGKFLHDHFVPLAF